MKSLNKKNNNERLPMPGKVKKGFRYYATMVMLSGRASYRFDGRSRASG